MKATTIIRLTLTMALLVGVYRETGIFTTVFVSMVAGYSEVLGFLMTKKGLFK